MKLRIRDKIQNFKPQGHISYKEWVKIEDRAIIARKFMDEKNPIYVWLNNLLTENLTDIEENRLRESRTLEFGTLFITPKKLQDDEAIGQIKMIRRLFKDLSFWISEKERYEDEEALHNITIERNEK